MKLEIVQKGNKVLETPTKLISEKEISSTDLQTLILDMHETLASSNNGVALAAPQVEANKRVFVISPNVFDMEEYHDLEIQTVLINPKIIWQSKDNKRMEEGCLSIPGVTGFVKRSTRATVEATDENGHVFEIEGKGLLAQIFQHEIDHLDGILFDSKATDLKGNE
jgi:peptide deformylase